MSETTGTRILNPKDEREAILRILSAAIFLVFFQAYLIAPLIPSLAAEFRVSESDAGLLVPGFLIPYGFSVLFYGPLSDRIGRRPVLLALLALSIAVTAGTVFARSVGTLLAWRILAGIATGGVTPIALALFSDLFSYAERGRAMGWIFGAIAGGSAFGSTVGALLNPYLGWRMEMALLAVASSVVLAVAWKHRRLLEPERHAARHSAKEIVAGYFSLLSTARGARTFGYIFLNGVFHGGIFAWLGVYFRERHGLSDTGIGLALLGYGIPGMLLGPVIGRWADRAGRRKIVPAGFLVAALAAVLFAPHAPLWVAALAAPTLSFGFDMSHPLLAGIVSSLDPKRRGQAMALNAFVLFTALGTGSLVFSAVRIPPDGMACAMLVFAVAQAGFGLAGFRLFAAETASRAG